MLLKMFFSQKKKEKEKEKEMSLCIVTAFMDLEREHWSHFSRSIDKYFSSFAPYTTLNINMVIFIDDRYHERLIGMLAKDDNKMSSYEIIKINSDFLRENIHAYKYLDVEREIMNSENFKLLINHRRTHPECSIPEYNIIQHAKIDFVSYVIERNEKKYDYYAWSDFGYFQFVQPKGDLDLTKFNLNRINFQGINRLEDIDFNIKYTLTRAPEKIGGFFYLGRPDLLIKYKELYHKTCQNFINWE